MKRFLMLLMAAMLLATAAGAESFVGMANPWIDTTREDLETRTGMHLGVPEGAENVLWRVLTTAGLAELRFILGDAEYTARAVPADYYRDISGMYYSWLTEQECRIAGSTGLLQISSSGEKLVQWYDEATGVMYALSVSVGEAPIVDVLALAETVCTPQSACSLAAVLADCTGMAGTAGASLKRAMACCDLLRYAVRMDAADCAPEWLDAAARAAWALLTPEQQAELALNLPAMNGLLTTADPLADGVFADAGVAEEAAALLADETALAHWAALYGTLAPLLPAE